MNKMRPIAILIFFGRIHAQRERYGSGGKR